MCFIILNFIIFIVVIVGMIVYENKKTSKLKQEIDLVLEKIFINKK